MAEKIKLPETFTEAEAIVDMKPLPGDYVEQLDELKDKTPAEYHDRFDEFYEAAFIQRGHQITEALNSDP